MDLKIYIERVGERGGRNVYLWLRIWTSGWLSGWLAGCLHGNEPNLQFKMDDVLPK